MPSLRSSGVCSREGDWSGKGEKGDGGDGARSSHRLLCGRETFGGLGLGSGGYAHPQAWLQKESWACLETRFSRLPCSSRLVDGREIHFIRNIRSTAQQRSQWASLLQDALGG